MRRPVRDALALGILLFLTLGAGALDVAVGRNISLWFLYVLPVAFAATIGGARLGAAFALLAAGLLVAVGLSVGHPFPTDGHFYFEVFGDLFAYFIVVLLSLGVRERLHRAIGELLPTAKENEAMRRTADRQQESPDTNRR